MILGSWALLLVASVLCGASIVAAMASPRPRQMVFGVLTLLMAASGVAGVAGVSLYSSRVDESLIAVVLGAAALLGGFALGGAILPLQAREPEAAALPDSLPDPLPGVGVIILACAEPEHYTPRAVARNLANLDAAEVPLPPEAVRVFIYASQKAQYRAAGESPSRPTFRAIADGLTSQLEGDGFRPARIAWCDDDPELDRTVVRLAEEGAREVVVSLMMVADDSAAARAKRRVDAMRPSEHGLRIRYTQPLWGSSAIAGRVAERILSAAGDTELASVGVALLGHGQPTEVEKTHPGKTEQETLFMQRVRASLLEMGFDGQRVRIGWIEWQDPEPTEVVRHLSALGCRKILVVPATMPADSLATRLDLRDAVTRSRVDSSDVDLLPAWGTDDVVVRALADEVRAAVSEQD